MLSVVILGLFDVAHRVDWLHGAGYLVPVLLAARLPRFGVAIAIALVCSALALAGAFLHAAEQHVEWVFRVPALFSIWTVVVFIAERRAAELKLQSSEHKYRSLIDFSPDGIMTVNDAGRIESVNRQLALMTGYEAGELIGKCVEVLVPERNQRHQSLVANYFRQPSARYMGMGRELALRHRDGHEIPVEIGLSQTVLADIPLVMATIRDVSARKRAAKALEDSERLLRNMADTVPGAIYQFERQADGHQRFNFISRNVNALLELDENERVTFDRFVSFIEPEDRPALLASIEQSALTLQPWIHEFKVRTRHGHLRWIRGHSLPFRKTLDGAVEWNGVISDITENRTLSEQLSHQAAHDGLTGLLNRRAFEQRLNTTFAAARTSETEVVLAYLDLDQFKVVNDTCGHGAGDELLRELAMMLKARLRESDALARLGGDEFAVLMGGGGLDNAQTVMERIREAIADFRFVWDDKTFHIGVSIGLVSISNEKGADVGEALRRADAACYAAKDAGRNCIHIYKEEDENLASQHGQVRWVPLINEAISHDRFELHAQPIIGLSDNSNDERHFEILLRMRLPSGDLASPGAFLPAAERYNLASRLDRWVVSKVFAWLRDAPLGEHSGTTYNINLSGLSIGDLDTTSFIIEHLRTDPGLSSRICFEITETTAISKLANAKDFIAQLKLLGCRFAIDDFGSGISSFGQLKNLDIDYIKIDGMFVRDIADDPVDRAMVTAINEMAHALGLLTVAEFVESQQVLDILRKIGVDFAQGYAIGKPTPLVMDVSYRCDQAVNA